VLPEDGVFHAETCRSLLMAILEPFNFNFNADLKLFLSLSNCASVGEKNSDNSQDTR
jgi:hypothetical protein